MPDTPSPPLPRALRALEAVPPKKWQAWLVEKYGPHGQVQARYLVCIAGITWILCDPRTGQVRRNINVDDVVAVKYELGREKNIAFIVSHSRHLLFHVISGVANSTTTSILDTLEQQQQRQRDNTFEQVDCLTFDMCLHHGVDLFSKSGAKDRHFTMECVSFDISEAVRIQKRGTSVAPAAATADINNNINNKSDNIILPERFPSVFLLSKQLIKPLRALDRLPHYAIRFWPAFRSNAKGSEEPRVLICAHDECWYLCNTHGVVKRAFFFWEIDAVVSSAQQNGYLMFLFKRGTYVGPTPSSRERVVAQDQAPLYLYMAQNNAVDFEKFISREQVCRVWGTYPLLKRASVPLDPAGIKKAYGVDLTAAAGVSTGATTTIVRLGNPNPHAHATGGCDEFETCTASSSGLLYSAKPVDFSNSKAQQQHQKNKMMQRARSRSRGVSVVQSSQGNCCVVVQEQDPVLPEAAPVEPQQQPQPQCQIQKRRHLASPLRRVLQSKAKALERSLSSSESSSSSSSSSLVAVTDDRRQQPGRRYHPPNRIPTHDAWCEIDTICSDAERFLQISVAQWR
eukprot:PhM_4_TR8173/c0_g1_i1/m.62771